MKYFGEKTRQDFIDLVYEVEVDIYYRKAIYTFWLDGNGYCVGMTSFNRKHVSHEMHENSIVFADTVEELFDKFVFYDGAKFSDVIEMDVVSYDTMEPVKK